MKIHILYGVTDGFGFCIAKHKKYQYTDESWQAPKQVLERFKKLGHDVTSGARIPDAVDVLVLAVCVCDACCFGSLGQLLTLLSEPYYFFRGRRYLRVPILIYRCKVADNEENLLIKGSIYDHCSDDVLQYELQQTAALGSNKT